MAFTTHRDRVAVITGAARASVKRSTGTWPPGATNVAVDQNEPTDTIASVEESGHMVPDVRDPEQTAQDQPAYPAFPPVIWQGTSDIPTGWGPSVVTIGVFDGVHRGHTRLIERTVERARHLQEPAVMITFDPHPAAIAGPTRDISTLSTPRQRAELAHGHGIDAVLILSFNPELSRMSASDFVQLILVKALRASTVVIGDGFRFGARGLGSLDTLRILGRRHDFTAESIGLLHNAEDTRFSSTYIRKCIADGDIAAATNALGRPYRIRGQLHGHAICVPPGIAVPHSGRYNALLSSHGSAMRPVHVKVSSPRRIILDGVSPMSENCAVTLDFLSSLPPSGTQ
jgi:riboflavin kinase/FMN adenylyltransferase